MTIASTTSKLLYNGDGATTDFAISFVFWQSSDIRVILRDANGVETVWTEGSHYTITGGGGSTGTLTVMTAPTDHTPASGEKLLIKSDIAEVQQAALPLGGAFPSTTVEQMVDIVTRLVQQHSEQIARTLVAAETDDDPGALPTSAARAGRYLAFDASGSAIASPGPAGEVAVSAFGASLVDDMSAPAARATLGLGGAAVKNTGTVNDTIPLLGANGALPASIGAFPRAVAGKTGAYSVVAADQGTLFVGDTAGGPFTITLPVLAGVADGFTVACKCDGANALTVAADGAETIDGAASLALDGDGYLVVTRADTFLAAVLIAATLLWWLN